MVRDIDLTNVHTYILYSENADALYPSLNIFPSEDLFPVSVEELDTIVSGTMKLDELIADSEIRFGDLYATKFEVQVYNAPDITGRYIQVFQSDGETVRTVFVGKVVSCKLDNSGYDRTIVAYDMSYIHRDVNVADWWNNFWANSPNSTVKQCRESLLDYMNIYYEDVVLPNDDVIIHKNVIVETGNSTRGDTLTGEESEAQNDISQEFSQNKSAMTFGNIISQLCEINACFPHMSRDDIMEFIMLNTRAVPIDITNKYEGLNSSFEDFVTYEITGIEFYDSDDELKYVVGDPGNVYKISSNIFLYDMGTSQLQRVGNTILDYISELSFTPATVKMIVGNLDLKLGDKVHTPKGDFYILENSYSSSQLVEQTISARGEQKLGESNRSLSDKLLVLNEKWSRLIFNVEQFRLEFGEYQTTVEGQFEEYSSSLEVNAKAIEAEVEARTGADEDLVEDYTAKIKVTAEAITSEVTARTNADTTLQSSITQTANSIRFKVDEHGEAVVDPVTGKSSFSSIISMESDKIELGTGRLIINSENFKLTADGTVTTENANIHGEIHCGTDNSGRIDIYDNIIKGNRDTYIDFEGTVDSSTGMHLNGRQIVLSTSALGITKSRNNTEVFYGYTGTKKFLTDVDVWQTVQFVNGILVK